MSFTETFDLQKKIFGKKFKCQGNPPGVLAKIWLIHKPCQSVFKTRNESQLKSQLTKFVLSGTGYAGKTKLQLY